MDRNLIARTTAGIRREYPHAVNKGTFPALFQRHDEPTDILPSPNGPPIYVEGGGASGSYTYRPTGDILTPEEYWAVCSALEAMTRTTGVTVGRNLTPAEIKRNKVRHRANVASEGGGRYD